MKTSHNCLRCRGEMFCEDHYPQPHGHEGCGGAGLPCPICWPNGVKPIVEWDEVVASDLPAEQTARHKARPS